MEHQLARLSKGAETLISMAFLVMCSEKILRLLRLFLSASVLASTTGTDLAPSGRSSGTFGGLKWPIHWPLYKRAYKPPTHCLLDAFGPSRWFAFSGVPKQTAPGRSSLCKILTFMTPASRRWATFVGGLHSMGSVRLDSNL